MNASYSAPLQQAFVGAGANLGDRAATLSRAVERLAGWPNIEAVECSSLYETTPVGPVAQPMFLNLVLGLQTRLTPEALLAALLEIEREFGRIRAERWGPRTLDLDLLIYENIDRRTAELELPHPRMFERTFVTVPLRELLERARFRGPKWDALRQRVGVQQKAEGIALFAKSLRGERS